MISHAYAHGTLPPESMLQLRRPEIDNRRVSGRFRSSDKKMMMPQSTSVLLYMMTGKVRDGESQIFNANRK
jgi:hypothetical protein